MSTTNRTRKSKAAPKVRREPARDAAMYADEDAHYQASMAAFAAQVAPEPKPVGRPPRQAEASHEIVRVRVTEEERERWERAAGELGWTTSELVREAMRLHLGE